MGITSHVVNRPTPPAPPVVTVQGVSNDDFYAAWYDLEDAAQASAEMNAEEHSTGAQAAASMLRSALHRFKQMLHL